MAQRILVIDDSPTMRQQLNACLSERGFEVVEAVDGLDGLEKAVAISLVICDVNMPRMNGIEFVQAMAKRQSNVPIVMLTTEGRPELVAEAKRAGARAWMVKPFQPSQLGQVVQKLALPA